LFITIKRANELAAGRLFMCLIGSLACDRQVYSSRFVPLDSFVFAPCPTAGGFVLGSWLFVLDNCELKIVNYEL
jgi:hypothetical protein